MTTKLLHHSNAMPMSTSPSAGSARAHCCERRYIAPFMRTSKHLIGSIAAAVTTRRHTRAACTPAVIGTPLLESP